MNPEQLQSGPPALLGAMTEMKTCPYCIPGIDNCTHREAALLPCPFCGDAAMPGEATGSWCGEVRKFAVVRCKNPSCLMRPETPSVIAGIVSSQSDEWPTPEQAVAAWNRRARSSGTAGTTNQKHNMQFDGDNNTDNIRTAGALPAAPCSPALAGLILQLESAVENARKTAYGARVVTLDAWCKGEEAAYRKAALMARQCQGSDQTLRPPTQSTELPTAADGGSQQ